MFAKRFPYAVYYEIENEIAYVVAVLPMRRDPNRCVEVAARCAFFMFCDSLQVCCLWGVSRRSAAPHAVDSHK